jgi:hypothetical protein
MFSGSGGASGKGTTFGLKGFNGDANAVADIGPGSEEVAWFLYKCHVQATLQNVGKLELNIPKHLDRHHYYAPRHCSGRKVLETDLWIHYGVPWAALSLADFLFRNKGWKRCVISITFELVISTRHLLSLCSRLLSASYAACHCSQSFKHFFICLVSAQAAVHL